MDRIGAYRAFIRVVRSGSFSAAARELGVGQPAISKQIAALESALDTALFTRSTRRLRLTDAGRRLYESAPVIVDEIERVEAAVRAVDHEPEGRLRVSLPVVFGQICVVPRLGEFLRRYPGIELDIRFSDRFVDLLEEGVDVVIRVGAAGDSSLVARKLGVTRRMVVASADYLEAHGRPRRPEQLRAHACLAYVGGRSRGTSWQLAGDRGTHAVPIEPRVRADNGQALRDLALQGVGIAMLATWLVGPDVESGRLEALLTAYEPSPIDVVALYPSRRFLPDRARRFVEFLQERFAPDPRLGATAPP